MTPMTPIQATRALTSVGLLLRRFGTLSSKAARQAEVITPTLPVLDSIVEATRATSPNLSLRNTILVCGQHLLNTTGSLVKSMITLGAEPSKIFIVGKSYSNNPQTVSNLKAMGVNIIPTSRQLSLGKFATSYSRDVNRLWTEATKSYQHSRRSKPAIIVLDDGGHVLDQTPTELLDDKPKIIGIEQTSSGVLDASSQLYPIIELATSAIKGLEAEFIATKASDTIREIFKDTTNDKIVGIVGFGHIGQAVFKAVKKMGFKRVFVYDANSEKTRGINGHAIRTKDALFTVADCIIGCTGKDIIGPHELTNIDSRTTPLTLISLSSKDIEFRTLLEYIHRNNRNGSTAPLTDIHYKNSQNVTHLIYNGGMPANFRNQQAMSVNEHDIQLIRGLLLQAVLQAKEMTMLPSLEGLAANYMLDPERQAFVSKTWLSLQAQGRYTEEDMQLWTNPKWITENSGGQPYQIQDLRQQTSNQYRPA